MVPPVAGQNHPHSPFTELVNSGRKEVVVGKERNVTATRDLGKGRAQSLPGAVYPQPLALPPREQVSDSLALMTAPIPDRCERA